MRVWSDDDMQFIEAEIVWSGSMRTPIPGIGGIERRRAYLTEGAPSSGKQSQEFPSQAEMRGKTDLIGLQIRGGLPEKRCSNGCGGTVSQAGMRHGYVRCQQCRRSGLGGRPRAKAAA